MSDQIETRRDLHRKKKRYCTTSRLPFYEIASRHFPQDENSVIIDIGSGKGEFSDYLELDKKYKKVFLLDRNEKTVGELKKSGKNAALYEAPGKIPFENGTVDYIHCSHLVEHLEPESLHLFLQEIDRVLKSGGILCISTPLLWPAFYSDLSHIKPYNPDVFLNYLSGASVNRSRPVISTTYKKLDLTYRYTSAKPELSSDLFFVDLILQGFHRLAFALKIRRFRENGYTLVLKK